MKNAHLISFIIFCGLGVAQQQKGALTQKQVQHTTNDTLHWNKDRKLTWDDFQGIPDTTSIGGAGTVSGFITKSKYTSDTTISVIISAVFYKQKSWQKTEYQTERALKHEQGHFDITEVYARKATAAFRKYKYNKETVNDDINRIFNSFVKKKDKTQALYDKETSHHRNLKKQKEWDAKIAKWLQECEQIQHNDSDTLHWNKDHKLTWDDFQGIPDTTSIGMAGTSSGFVTKSKYLTDSTISVVVSAVFYKKKSWVKDSWYKAAYALNHEQRHFDITEVYARKSTAAFKKYKYNKKTVNKDIDSIINYFFHNMNEIQDMYDKESKHSIDTFKQKEWDAKIDKWLQECEH